MERLYKYCSLLGLVLAGACGDDSEAPGGDAAVVDGGADAMSCTSELMVDLAGSASLHPAVALADSGAELGSARITLEQATQRLVGRSAALQHGDCTDASTVLEAGAAADADWSFESVNTRPLSLALIASVDDGSGEDRLFETTTGLAEAPVEEDRSDLAAFVLTIPTVDALAASADMTTEELASGGFILGMFRGAEGAPAAGVTLVNGSGAPVDKAIYPNADLSGSVEGVTSESGLYLLTGVGLGTYGGATVDGRVFETQQAALLPGTAFIMFLGETEAQ